MNQKIDKLAPGLHAKLTLAVDLALIVVVLMLSIDWATKYAPLSASALTGAAIAGWFVAISILRLYNPYTPRGRLDNVALAILASVGMAAFLWALDSFFLSPPAHFDPVLFTTLVAGTVLITQLFLLDPLRKTQEPKEDVLIVGTRSLAVATFKRMQEPGSRFNVVGFVKFEDSDPELPASIELPVLDQGKDGLLRVLEKQTFAEVYLAERVMDRGRDMQKLVKLLEELGVPFAVPLHSLRFNRAQLMSTERSRDGYLHYLNSENKPLQWAIKRLLDIVLASIGLLMLSPLLIAVAIIIKAGDGGPVLFKQTRVGLHGAHFNFLKFRSMVINAEALKDELLKFNEQTGPAFKMKHDPRITRVGRFIRKYSIDELPQLINILRGDMTIVGPRPPVPREVAVYKPWQRRRLSVRPGLTCYWQVGGRNEIGFDEWMLLDLRYVDHWSLSKDIQLIAKTIPVVVLGKGAS